MDQFLYYFVEDIKEDLSNINIKNIKQDRVNTYKYRPFHYTLYYYFIKFTFKFLLKICKTLNYN